MRKAWVRAVGYFEVVGGGLIVIGGWYLRHDATGHLTVSFPLIVLGVGVLSIGAGALLLAEKPGGLAASLFVQGFQIVRLNIGWRYVFLAGPELNLLLSSAGARVSGGGGGQFVFTTAPPDGTLSALGVSVAGNLGWMFGSLANATWATSINFIALYLFIRLWRLDDELTIQAEKAKRIGSSEAAA